jgi:hypothetical protein
MCETLGLIPNTTKQIKITFRIVLSKYFLRAYHVYKSENLCRQGAEYLNIGYSASCEPQFTDLERTK